MNEFATSPPTLQLIRAARDGDREAVDRLFALAYGELFRASVELNLPG